MKKGIKAVLFYLAVAVIVFVGIHIVGNFNEVSDAIRHLCDRKPAFSGAAFDGWWRGKQR